MDEAWRMDGDRFADTFNARQAIVSESGRLGYLKVLREDREEDPWIEQWANEQIVSDLAKLLDIPAVDAAAGVVEGERGAIIVFMEGRKLNELSLTGHRLEPVLEGAANRDQFGLIVAFDVWMLNVDRHGGNFFVRTEEGRPRLHLIDHGHTLLLPRPDKKAEPAPENWGEFVVSGVLEDVELTRRTLGSDLRQHVKHDEIRAGARRIAQLGDEDIAKVVDAVPGDFYCGPTPEAMTSLLVNRRNHLEELLEAAL